MATTNQNALIQAPFRGLYNTGPQWAAPPGTGVALKNVMTSWATGYVVSSRWGVTREFPLEFGANTAPGSESPVWIGASADATSRTIVITRAVGATAGRIYYRTGAGAWTDISGGITHAGTTLDLTTVLFDKAGVTYLLICNGVDTPKKWTRLVAANWANFASYPEAYKASMVVADRLVVGNLATSGTAWVDCSSSVDFEAGWNINMVKLADTPGPIVAMRSMGATQGVIYKSDAIYLCIPQAGPAPFRYELRASGIAGPATERAVVQLPDGTHLYLGSDGEVYRFDGSNLTQASPLCTSPLSVKNHVLATQLAEACGIYWPQRREVYFFYPSKTIVSPNVNPGGGLCISYPDMAIFPLAFPAFPGGVAPGYGYPTVDATCCGLIPPAMEGGWVTYASRYLALGRLRITMMGPGTTNHIGVAATNPDFETIEHSSDGGYSGGGGWTDYYPYGTDVDITMPEMIPANAALVTMIESEQLLHAPLAGKPAFPASQMLTTAVTTRLYGVAGSTTGAQVDMRSSSRKMAGMTSSAVAQALAPRVYGSIFSKLEYYGARFAFYVGQDGRR